MLGSVQELDREEALFLVTIKAAEIYEPAAEAPAVAVANGINRDAEAVGRRARK
jgi:hypothetical protein